MKLSKPLIVLFLGRQGSGKGTQAEFLGEKFGLDYVGSGDLFRARQEIKDFSGKKIAAVMKKGGLHPTCIIFKLWFDKFEELKNKKNLKGFIIDGSPRKLPEAFLIDEALEWYEWNKNVKIFLINISEKEAIQRLTKRRMCQKCRKIIPFVGEFKKMEDCPECQGKLIKRTDDTLPAIKERLRWFETDVQPVINFYRKTGRLIKINGEQSIEDVFKDVLKAVK